MAKKTQTATSATAADTAMMMVVVSPLLVIGAAVVVVGVAAVVGASTVVVFAVQHSITWLLVMQGWLLESKDVVACGALWDYYFTVEHEHLFQTDCRARRLSITLEKAATFSRIFDRK